MLLRIVIAVAMEKPEFSGLRLTHFSQSSSEVYQE
jgi:hypothetical protein